MIYAWYYIYTISYIYIYIPYTISHYICIHIYIYMFFQLLQRKLAAHVHMSEQRGGTDALAATEHCKIYRTVAPCPGSRMCQVR